MKLFPFQQKALQQTQNHNRCAYYLDMGLGKTFVGAEKMHQLGNRVNIVVCQKNKVDDWIEHFKENYDVSVFDLTNKKEVECFKLWIEAESPYPASKVICVGVINYDLLYRRSYFSHISDFTLLLDESSVIQNETAKRSKFILKMNPQNVILLSGTPTSGKYEKLWSQLHLLGWNISKKLFYSQYVEQEWIEDKHSGFRIPVIVGYKNVDRLKAKLASYGAIFMKSEEVFDLPEQQEITVKVSATKAYKKFMKDSYLMLDTLNCCEFKDDSDYYGTDTTPRAELIGDTGLAKKLYARQLCGQYNKEKLGKFRELLESTEDRLIVFYNYNEELARLKNIALDYTDHISVIRGDEKDLTAYEQFEDSITFVQYQAGAMGVNLQKANKIIYFTLTDRSELFEQSKKRTHRIGQDRTCFYYYLVCTGSVEERIRDTLQMRKDYNDALFEKEYCS